MALRPAEDIKKDVTDRLYWDDRVDAAQINIDVNNSTVTLRGTVPSVLSLEAALWDARNVAGVSEVVDDIRIYPGEVVTMPADLEIANNAQSVLEWSPHLDSTDIEVSVEAGRLTLRGSVDAFWKKMRAENLVNDLAGVVEVVNELTVVPGGDLRDQAIAEEIVAELERSTLVNADDITVVVDHGAVTLTGTVRMWSARHAAYEAALFTGGVTDIHDNIKVAG